MNKQAKYLAALTRAARRQPDPVKRQRIVDKIREVKQRQEWNKFLAQ